MILVCCLILFFCIVFGAFGWFMITETGMDEGFMIFWVRVAGTFFMMATIVVALGTLAYLFNAWGFVR